MLKDFYYDKETKICRKNTETNICEEVDKTESTNPSGENGGNGGNDGNGGYEGNKASFLNATFGLLFIISLL